MASHAAAARRMGEVRIVFILSNALVYKMLDV